MPPAAPVLERQPLPNGDELQLKVNVKKGVRRLRVYRELSRFKYDPVWLYRDASDRLNELLEAHDDITKDDVGESFRARLVNGTWFG